jgi:hypothetical protein
MTGAVTFFNKEAAKLQQRGTLISAANFNVLVALRTNSFKGFPTAQACLGGAP